MLSTTTTNKPVLDLISNNSNIRDVAVGIEFTDSSGSAPSGITVINESTLTPASSMAFITGDFNGKSIERMRIHENGNVTIGSTENQVETFLINYEEWNYHQ